jgi:hypothetical protein
MGQTRVELGLLRRRGHGAGGVASQEMKLKLLVTPLAKGAFYDAYLDVARAELAVHFPALSAELAIEQLGGLDFICAPFDADALPTLARLACVQGAFSEGDDGALRPLLLPSDLRLPEAWVYGVKYRGKTHELVTQLALNVALRCCESRPEGRGGRPLALLDPLAGKGTTLLWALRYGLNARGIELDPAAPDALHAHIKKQTKLHRLSHRHDKGSVGKRRKDGVGRFVQYELEQRSLRLITGDSRDAKSLLGGQRFDLLVSDLPYGVQFRREQRGGLRDLIADCAPGWVASLRDGGVAVLIFNNYQPTRAQLIELFEPLGCEVLDFSAPHRMSESIVRELLVLRRRPSSERS